MPFIRCIVALTIVPHLLGWALVIASNHAEAAGAMSTMSTKSPSRHSGICGGASRHSLLGRRDRHKHHRPWPVVDAFAVSQLGECLRLPGVHRDSSVSYWTIRRLSAFGVEMNELIVWGLFRTATPSDRVSMLAELVCSVKFYL